MILYNPPSPIPFWMGMATCERTQLTVPLTKELHETAEELRPCNQYKPSLFPPLSQTHRVRIDEIG